MLFNLFWGDFTILIVIPGILLALWAQLRVKMTFSSFSRVPAKNGMTGADAARRILDENGLYDVRIEPIQGQLTDHYDPRDRVLRLSESSFASSSVAAVGVAAHEAGHAIQHARGYVPLTFRMALVPVTNFGSRLASPLFIIGLILSVLSTVGDWFMLAGIIAFSLSVFFQLVTLPVEFNASRRALRCLSGSGLLDGEELRGARRVLSAAALTYVASLAVGLLSLLRLLVIAASSSSRRRR